MGGGSTTNPKHNISSKSIKPYHEIFNLLSDSTIIDRVPYFALFYRNMTLKSVATSQTIVTLQCSFLKSNA